MKKIMNNLRNKKSLTTTTMITIRGEAEYNLVTGEGDFMSRDVKNFLYGFLAATFLAIAIYGLIK
ncbi:hypothetical protein [Cohnella soli]|uniref:Uncharacterized protein n=1 Tax=Cohnella soli TaxID=425005 RepID=A0ABW0HMW8_9BACL